MDVKICLKGKIKAFKYLPLVTVFVVTVNKIGHSQSLKKEEKMFATITDVILIRYNKIFF